MIVAIEGRRLWVSVSGGRTSMMMARLIQLALGATYELRFVFANTGEEHPATLEFVHACDQAWGLGIIWIEAVTHPGERKQSTHKVVDYATAARCGEPFRAMIEKYGIPNKNFPHCNRELKLRPMQSYIRSIGWDGVPVAIGIRADEPRRLSPKAKAMGVVYPMAHWWPMDKADVSLWWDEQPFSLAILEREGNCKWCWKKSEKKHFLNLSANPEWYEFPALMESLHSTTNRDNPQVFFRGGLSTRQLIQRFELSHVDPRMSPDNSQMDGCSESCEAFQ